LELRELGCGAGNAAKYGPCLATSYRVLEVVGLPTHDAPAYPGLAFTVTVVKKDGYNQTVFSDSISTVKVQPVHSAAAPADIIAVAAMTSGEARVSLVLRPLFVWRGGTVELASAPGLLLTGADAQTGGAMQVATAEVAFARGEGVCPDGHVLLLESSVPAGDALQGYCSVCGPGTYSVSPLAGPSPSSLPACLECLSGAICYGGSSVDLPVGYWAVRGGAYRLVGCPSGHQLVDSINGVFSYGAQACIPCGIGRYVLDPNSSHIACQFCPAGGVCDGAGLQSRVAGAVWVADMGTGLYTLLTCPLGYERVGAAGQADQACRTCPASHFCTGGKASAEPCPDGAFATPGANASGACAPAILVAVLAVLPISLEEFDAAAQTRFAEALGDSCSVAPSRIMIRSIRPLRRSSSGASVQVDSRIAASDASAAAALSSRIKEENLNEQLARQGLPLSSIQSVAALLPPSAPASISPGSLGAVVACLGLLVVLLAALLARAQARHQALSQEALLEAARIDALRRRLGITASEGFIVGTERVPVWWRRPVVQVFRNTPVEKFVFAY
jgi:hypothetical protein